jgi:CRP-like cAMP-binding protein
MVFDEGFLVHMAVRRCGNSILEDLPSSEFNSISPELKRIELSRGAVLFEPDTPVADIYFPIDSVISFVGDTGDRGSIEVWSVGREGAAGFSGVLGRTEPFRGLVQVPGEALISKAGILRRQFQKGTAFHDAMLGYYQSLLVQVAYLEICNNRHAIEQRFCRWLLMIHDRAGTDELNFTQDAISAILGTRRATISVAAAALQSTGLISYTPGSIRIRSRKALEKAACGCYGIINGRR